MFGIIYFEDEVRKNLHLLSNSARHIQQLLNRKINTCCFEVGDLATCAARITYPDPAFPVGNNKKRVNTSGMFEVMRICKIHAHENEQPIVLRRKCYSEQMWDIISTRCLRASTIPTTGGCNRIEKVCKQCKQRCDDI